MSAVRPWKTLLWTQLQKNIEKQGLSSCYLSLALPTPSVRTVVFRSFAGEHHVDDLGWTSDCLVVTTDRRSRKCKELEHDRRYEACWYMNGTGEQFRLKGTVAMYPQDDVALMPPVTPRHNITTSTTATATIGNQAFLHRQNAATAAAAAAGGGGGSFDWEAERRRHFGLLDNSLRATFSSHKPASLAITGIDASTGWYVSPDQQLLDEAYNNFCLLVLTVKEMDYVSLEGAHEIYSA